MSALAASGVAADVQIGQEWYNRANVITAYKIVADEASYEEGCNAARFAAGQWLSAGQLRPQL
jgi:hypothetical protein